MASYETAPVIESPRGFQTIIAEPFIDISCFTAKLCFTLQKLFEIHFLILHNYYFLCRFLNHVWNFYDVQYKAQLGYLSSVYFHA